MYSNVDEIYYYVYVLCNNFNFFMKDDLFSYLNLMLRKNKEVFKER